MNSVSDILENRRPPKISNNPHEQVEPADISLNFNDTSWLRLNVDSSKASLQTNGRSLQPVPRHPISLAWCPDTLCINVGDCTVTKKLCLLNVCPRSIYIHCCGLWNEDARLGAHWRCYPKTRFLLAPGLHAEVFVRAEPKSESPILCARVGLQVAAAHMRDHVVAYFAVPLMVRFTNYVTTPMMEQSGQLSAISDL